MTILSFDKPCLLVRDVAWNLKQPCNDCPFRRDAPDHAGIVAHIPAYIETIHEGRFAHTCHKTDNRADGPQNYTGDQVEHCAGALHFLIRAGRDLQLPLLNAAEAKLFDITEATRDANLNERVFGSVDELLTYYLNMGRRLIALRKADPLIYVMSLGDWSAHPELMLLSKAVQSGREIVSCSKCGLPATWYDSKWPYFTDMNFCNECGDHDGLPEAVTELAELVNLEQGGEDAET